DNGVYDDDEFTVDVPPGCRVDAEVRFDHSAGTLIIVASRGVRSRALATPTPDGGRIAWGNASSRTESTQLFVGNGTGGCLAYDLDAALVCPPACPPDVAEPNQVREEAMPIALDADGRYHASDVGLAGPVLDHDVWSVEEQPGCTLLAS